MLDTLLLPFQFGFMQNAYLLMALIAVPASLLSCFLVLKGWSLMGDAISHAVLPGVILAYLLGLPLLIGAFVAGLICTLLTGYVTAQSRVKEDTVMGVVFSGMFGAGLVMHAKITTNVDLGHILYGNLLGVGSGDLWIACVICGCVSAAILVLWRALMLYVFDPVQARALGLWVPGLHYGLLIMIALTIVATLSAAGMILAIGLLIAPGAIAFLLTRRFAAMLVVATLVTLFSGLCGITLSFYLDSAPAPTVILVLSVIFVCAFGWAGIAARQTPQDGSDLAARGAAPDDRLRSDG